MTWEKRNIPYKRNKLQPVLESAERHDAVLEEELDVEDKELSWNSEDEGIELVRYSGGEKAQMRGWKSSAKFQDECATLVSEEVRLRKLQKEVTTNSMTNTNL